MNMHFKSLLSPLIALLLGFSFGIFYERSTASKPYYKSFGDSEYGKHSHKRKMDFFSKELNLSEEQQQKVTAIFNNSRTQLQTLHQQVHPEFKRLRKEARAQVREILTPEQRQKFDVLQQKKAERRKLRRFKRD